MAEVEPLILVADEFVEAAVFLEEIEVVQARHEQDVPDPDAHQVLEALEAGAVTVLDPERGSRSKVDCLKSSLMTVRFSGEDSVGSVYCIMGKKNVNSCCLNGKN